MHNAKDILTRGVEQVLPSKDGLAKLMAKKKIKLYLGIDPTGTKLHLGHSIALRKLQQFANLGHEAILLFGTGTVLAGDPSQREQAREKIAAEQIKHNISTWKDQVKKIIDFNKINVMYNGEWLLKLNLGDIIEIASNISAVQLFKRDMFQKRMERGDTVWTHELLYPLLQGYDSVAMNVDLEIGGTDQTFNMLIGRELQDKMNHHEKYVLSVPMINGLDGKPMSKTSGNCVWLADSPEEMFGKIMSISDDQIRSYFILLTDLSEKDIDTKLNKHPLVAKKSLAHEIVKIYHSEKSAQEAQEKFERTFQKKEFSQQAEVIKGAPTLAETLASLSSIGSMSQAKRLLAQGAVDVSGETVKDGNYRPRSGEEIKVGKKTFVKIK